MMIMMKISLNHTNIKEFQQFAKENKVKYDPFIRKTWRTFDQHITYEIDIIDPGAIETFLRLKYTSISD
jgi:hypothetical protein